MSDFINDNNPVGDKTVFREIFIIHNLDRIGLIGSMGLKHHAVRCVDRSLLA